jgi:hypothetical protein
MIPYMVLNRAEKIQIVLDTNIIPAGLYSTIGASFQVLRALYGQEDSASVVSCIAIRI